MKTQDQKPNIKTITHPDINTSVNYWAIVTSFLIFDLGVGSMFFSQYIIGAILISLGLIILVVKYRRTIYEKTGSPIKFYSKFFEKANLVQIEKILSEESFKDANPIKFDNDGNAKIEYISSEDKQFAAIQVLEYVPFTYEPYTSIYFYSGDKAVELAGYLERCKVQR